MLGLLSFYPAAAQTTAPTPIPISDNQVNAVARNLYCPVCRNTPLDVCPTEACARWREQVRELLAAGDTEEQVRQYFIATFNMSTVGVPLDAPSQLLTIILPLGVVGILGAVAVWEVLRRRRRLTAPIEPTAAVFADPAAEYYRSRLEDELKDRS